MAEKTYRNHTQTLQVVYDGDMQAYAVVPEGTVDLDENVGKRYGCLRVVDTKKKVADDKKPDDGKGETAK